MAKVVAKEAVAQHLCQHSGPRPHGQHLPDEYRRKLTDIIGQDGTEFLNHLIALGRHAQPEEIARDGTVPSLRSE